MTRAITFFLLATVSLLLAPNVCSADERQEQQERVERLRRAAAQLAEQGLGEHAERLEQEAQELSREINAQQEFETGLTDFAQVIERQEGMLRDLRREGERLREIGAPEAHRAEVEKQLRNVERDLDRLRAEQPRPVIMHRVEHLRIAAEHLDQAGMPDMAHQLRRKAETLQREGEQHQHHSDQPAGRPGDHHVEERLSDQLRELRQEMSRLREELNELRSHLFGR